MMETKLVLEKIEEKDRELFKNLYQLYIHDITLFLPMGMDEDCLFKFEYENGYFGEKSKINGRFSFFIKDKNKTGNQIIGFVLVNKEFMVLKNEKNDYNMAEMFVINEYKCKGVGKSIANMIFDMFKGKWEVKPVPRSDKAKAFWERTINERTGGNYKTEFPKPNRTTFIFES